MTEISTHTPMMCLGNGTEMFPYHKSSVDNSSEDYYKDFEEDELVELRKTLNIISIIVYCLAFVFGVAGNGIVIWVSGFRMKKTVNTVWFLNLAVADFLFTAFLPFSVAYTALDFHWPFGRFMCKLNSTLSLLNMFASVYMLVVISVDRCMSVAWPIWTRNHRSIRRASLLSLGVWGFSLLLSSPYFVFRDIAPHPANENMTICFNNFAFSDDNETAEVVEPKRHHDMIITRFVLGFVLPFSIIVSCYAVIIPRLKRSHSMSGHTGRSFKIIAAIITTFFLCWAPYHILVLIEMAYHMTPEHSPTLDYVIAIGIPIATNLAFLNSCLNPFLYVFIGQDFKYKMQKSILKLLETAFTEEVTRSNTYTNSINTSKEQGSKSFSEMEV